MGIMTTLEATAMDSYIVTPSIKLAKVACKTAWITYGNGPEYDQAVMDLEVAIKSSQDAEIAKEGFDAANS